MKTVTIANAEISVDISTKGAEVQSVKDAKTGAEYLWQGDARWWSGRSPILFPIVGGMWDGVCRIGGKEVRIPKHGFVKGREWRLAHAGAESACFEYTGTVGDYEVFPYAFRLSVTYSVEGRTLRADIAVANTGGETLWFQTGGHPAIALPGWCEDNAVDGWLRLEGKPEYIWRAGDQGCLEPDKLPVPAGADGLIPLCVETFANEALIFDNGQVTAATVLGLDRQPVARVASGSPCWLFWSPTGKHSPFVCAEPWYGLCDHQHFAGPVEERPFINHAAPGATWTGWYTVEAF